MDRRPPCEDGLVLEEAAAGGVVDPRGAKQEPLAAVPGEDLEPALALIPKSPEPGAGSAIRDDRSEAVVFSGGRRDWEKCAIDYFPRTAVPLRSFGKSVIPVTIRRREIVVSIPILLSRQGDKFYRRSAEKTSFAGLLPLSTCRSPPDKQPASAPDSPGSN
jgi:hypothetical protein